MSVDQQKLKQLLLFILNYAKSKGIDNLTKYQLMKLTYIIEVESRKFTGQGFINNIEFYRYPRGPISLNIDRLLTQMRNDLIDIEIEEIAGEKDKYRHSHSLKSGVNLKFNFTQGETFFLTSILEDFIALPMWELKDIVYDSEPMQKLLSQEKGTKKVGAHVPLEEVSLDEELLSLVLDENEY